MASIQRVKKCLFIITGINILLVIIGITLFNRAVKLGKIIDDSVENEYVYLLNDRQILLTLPNGKKVHLVESDNGIKVKDIYKYNSDKERAYIVMFIKNYNKVKEGSLKREVLHILGECRLHTILYKIGYKKEQTADVDIDNEKDDRWAVNILSFILY